MTNVGEIVESGTVWLDALPNYQRVSVDALLAEMPETDAAKAWIAASVAPGTAPFGAAQTLQIFYEKFLDEMHDLLCSESRYEAERNSLKRQFRPGQTTFVGGVAASIAPHLGVAAPLVAPAVALTLAVIGTAGLNAWCATQRERHERVLEGDAGLED